ETRLTTGCGKTPPTRKELRVEISQVAALGEGKPRGGRKIGSGGPADAGPFRTTFPSKPLTRKGQTMIAKLWGRRGAAARAHGGDPAPELWCMGLYDDSGSMGERAPGAGLHSKREELNAVITTLPQEILKDPQAAGRVKLGAITFGCQVK